MRYIVGLVGFPLGLIIIVYREHIKNVVGNFELPEKWFGAGGTYTAILLFGLFVSVGSLMYMLGTLQFFLAPLINLFFTS